MRFPPFTLVPPAALTSASRLTITAAVREGGDDDQGEYDDDAPRCGPERAHARQRVQAACAGIAGPSGRSRWQRRFRHMRLLLVEDDPELATILEAGLREQGIHVARAATMPAARAEATRNAFDVIVLDVMLPGGGGSGLDLCGDLRRQGIATPILMLTARDTIDDRVVGLEVGADDYVTKPFAFRELVARVRALARRRPALIPRVATVADLEVDLASRQVRRGGRTIELTAKEFALLEFFVLHRGEVVDRAAITAHVWDDNHDPFTNVLEVLVRRLRRKIDDDFEPKLIHTLRGAGYRFAD